MFIFALIIGAIMIISEKDFSGFITGQEKAFEAIFRQYYKTLVSFSMRYGLEQMEAEDVVIEAIHRIWQMRRDVESAAALHTLFFTSVRNRTVNVVRNNKNRERIIGSRENTEAEEFRDHLMEEEVSRLLNEAVTALPPQCRQVVMLLLTGESVADIAGKMDISVSSVKTYKARAIEILRGTLKDYPCVLWLLISRLR